MIKLFTLLISLSKKNTFLTLVPYKGIKQLYVLQENYDILTFRIGL